MSDMQFVLQNIPHKRGVNRRDIVSGIFDLWEQIRRKWKKNIWNISDMNDLVRAV